MTIDDFGLRPGTAADAPGIARLLRSCKNDCVAESEAWIRRKAHHFQLALDHRGAIAASAALIPARTGSFVLRSVAVSEEFRGAGLARLVLHGLLARPWARSAAIWCRTRRPAFFKRFAFRELIRRRESRPGARHWMLRSPRVSSPSRPTSGHPPIHSKEENTMSTEAALFETPAALPQELDLPRPARRRRRLAVLPATYDDMSVAADIIRSTADWYRPFVDPEDMKEHEVGPEWIEENFDRRNFYLGWRNRDPVGVLSTQSAGRHMYLGYVYLYESKVGNGYGRELLEFARMRAARQGKKALALIAHPEAQWATAAYERFGFEKIAEDRSDVLAWNGGWLEPYYEEGFGLYECPV